MFNNSDTGALLGTVEAHSVTLNEIEVLTPEAPTNTHATLSLSKNNKNFHKIEGIGKTSLGKLYTYYDAPIVKSIDPRHGPVKMEVERNVTISGSNFYCFDEYCTGLKCKFDVHPYPIYTKAYLINSSTIKCLIPQLSRPETVDVEISLNGNDFTRNGI
jgi:hypothetical protein